MRDAASGRPPDFPPIVLRPDTRATIVSTRERTARDRRFHIGAEAEYPTRVAGCGDRCDSLDRMKATNDDGERARPSGPHGAAEPDWSSAAAFLSRRLRRLLPAADPQDVADLAQEALIDLVRTHRHEPVRNLEALLNALARRKVIDHVRRRDRWRVLLEPLDEERGPALAEAVHLEHGEPLERLRFTVLELFTRDDAGCRDLAERYFAGYAWAEVAAATGRAETTVRKQWSRCVAHLRRTLGTGPERFWTAPVARKGERS